MSSEQNIQKRARKSSTTSKNVTSISKKRKNNIETLTTYNTDNLLNQAMVSVVTSLYASGDIRNIKTATNALDILTKDNNIKNPKPNLQILQI